MAPSPTWLLLVARVVFVALISFSLCCSFCNRVFVFHFCSPFYYPERCLHASVVALPGLAVMPTPSPSPMGRFWSENGKISPTPRKVRAWLDFARGLQRHRYWQSFIVLSFFVCCYVFFLRWHFCFTLSFLFFSLFIVLSL